MHVKSLLQNIRINVLATLADDYIALTAENIVASILLF